MSVRLFLFASTFLFLLHVIDSAVMSQMNAPKCEEFCPTFCQGKCSGNAKSNCNAEACHCDCPTTGVGCKEDECKDFCSKHSGGRVFKSTCMKSTVCKCNLGDPSDPSDPSKENMNIMEYPLTGDYRAEVRILPK